MNLVISTVDMALDCTMHCAAWCGLRVERTFALDVGVVQFTMYVTSCQTNCCVFANGCVSSGWSGLCHNADVM